MEVLQGEPLRLEDLLRGREAKGAEHACHELVVGHAVLFSATDVICLVPEVLRHPILADLCKQSARILDCGPLEHASHRNMECRWVHDAEDSRIQNACLPQRHPILQTRRGEDLL